MAIAVEMPKPGNTVDECLLAKWVRAPGSRVSAGDVIAEIETDKATFEVPSPADGVLLATFYEEGALVPVYSNIAVIGQPGEDPQAFAPAPAAVSGNSVERSDSPTSSPAAAPQPVAADTEAAGFASPRARRYAAEHGVRTEGIRGSGPDGRILERDVRDFFHSSPKLSSLARERAAEGLEAGAAGSGLHGMVLGADLAEAGVPLGRTREKIARRMRESVSQTAQYTLHASAGAGGLLALRAHIKARGRESSLPDININELVLFCAVQALLRMPDLNAELRGGKLFRHARVHLGFACDTDRGLLVPVIHDAHLMTVADLASAAKALTERAVKGSISPDDLTGATFTVSNLGSLGIESFTPILNPPQVAILGIDAIQVRAVRTPGGIELADRIGLSLTCDHQVIDGAPGARFLRVVRDCIEQVESLSGLRL
jgi:pyruvate dehydrogenase E2 component (dihydrolipoamide acetyltransferase)